MDFLSGINNILPAKGTEPRKTEKSDADNHIDKEDLDRHRRGKSNTNEYERRDIYEDLAQVSIILLRGFLQNLLDTKDYVHDARREQIINTNYAMKAYQTANTRSADDVAPPPTINDSVEVAGFSKLDLAAASLDKNEIKLLITSLTHLEHAGIQFLEIQRGDSFLGAIKDAIERVKENNA